MRKIPSELENPFDDVFIGLGDYFSEYFKKMNLTANDLTSVSFITGLYSIYLFIKEKYVLSAIFYMLSHIFDCFDGYYARKYNMVSEFGDYYDHITDYIIDGIMLYLIIKKYLKLQNNNLKKYVPLILIPIIGLSMMHLGCQEQYFDANIDKKGHWFLSNLKQVCPVTTNNKTELTNILKFSRFFGTGTQYLSISAIILFSSTVDADIKKGK